MQSKKVGGSSRWFVLGLALALVGAGAVVMGAAQTTTPATAAGDPLIAGFKSTYAASVSDAVEIVTGKNGTMRYDMKLMTGANLVGRAVHFARAARSRRAGHSRARHQTLRRDDRRSEAR